jgi:hypothetical protein
MRSSMVLGSGVLLVSWTALAGGDSRKPSGDRPHVDSGGVPAECRAWVDDANNAKSDTLYIAARLSTANCMARSRMDANKPAGDDASIRALVAAVKPSLAILDEVAGRGDPSYQIIADDAAGDLYANVVVRLRMTGRVAEPQLTPLLGQAVTAFKEAVRIAKLHPDLASGNAVVASAVHHSEANLGIAGSAK